MKLPIPFKPARRAVAWIAGLVMTTVALTAQSLPDKSAAAPIAPPNTHTPLTNQVTITIQGEYRLIKANGLPDHTPGRFPNRGNPNSISAQNYNFRVPVHPRAAEKPVAFNLGLFGVAINGVVFDPGANEWWNGDRSSGWQYDPLAGTLKLGVDQNNAHVQPNGAYHYHGIPTGLVAKLKGAREGMLHLGWAADGFPIYAPWAPTDSKDLKSPIKTVKSSYRLKSGTRPDGPGGAYNGEYVRDFEYAAGQGDLDECNGRWTATPEFPAGTYAYFVTAEFPFVPRLFHGIPDPSFQRRGPPPGGRRGPGRGPAGGFGPPPGGGPPDRQP